MRDLFKVSGRRVSFGGIELSFPHPMPDGRVFGPPYLLWGGQFVSIEQPERYGAWLSSEDCLSYMESFMRAVTRRGLRSALVA